MTTMYWWSFAGGVLLGISALLLLLMDGKIAGISGIVTRAIKPQKNDALWRYLFLFGLIVGGWLGLHSSVGRIPSVFGGSTILYITAGVLVGVGTRLGNGCTSGHGICGMGRLSVRSIAATCTFMLVGAVVVFIWQHLIGA
ncbi:YeeE/YedE family protein [Vibrio nitrifigilis]|uniref:YeeE/YedE family protein n=1 Tax=Vibrio nitrifigilis TaxID=2789781 RepID=A0ABS0GJU0_9VIBR|nr:YeeE/YedE thiosulfate transporter family protein [Vibrio nitrifigilis]MBF9002729.1 YeeE/YedE family protein [Vibrio nitrifigilis]